MRIYRSLSPKSLPPPTALCIGNFDGLHLGHQALLNTLLLQAKSKNYQSAIMTFEPHPKEFFAPAENSLRLFSLCEKLRALQEIGIEQVYLMRFNQQFSSLTAENFIHLCQTQLNVRSIVVGEDFRFGASRQGDLNTLKQAEMEVILMPSVYLENKKIISSSTIRKTLLDGNFEEAAQFLGRHFSIFGNIIRGKSLGKVIGFPTANIAIKNQKLPLRGVYIVTAEIAQKTFPGVANIGKRPTVEDDNRILLEVHLLNSLNTLGDNEQIYGEKASVNFYAKIRDEIKFSDISALKEQIAKDIKIAKEWHKISDA